MGDARGDSEQGRKTPARVPETCFSTLPPDIERLRQTLCNPYRIVYEAVGGQIRILAIMHSRMLVWSSDTRWA